jgi:Domain of Unknown Function (DUF928)
MIYFYPSIYKTLTSLTLAGAISIVASISESAQAIQFNAPEDSAPADTTGGGVRGDIQFLPPGDTAPDTSTGGGVRGDIQFLPPGDTAPDTSTDESIQGDVQSLPPGDTAPDTSTDESIQGDVQFLPPGDTVPQTFTSSGIRGNELADIVPLLPPAKYGRTIEARPTMLVYVPPTQKPQHVFFSVQDENRRNLYQTMLELPGEGGIIRITLPEGAPELELGKTYAWFLAPVPSEGFLRPDNYGVVGWVKRVESPVGLTVAANSIERATAYAASGIWYDTLNLVAAAQQAQPDNPKLASEWQDLLKQVGLEAVADQPLTRSF